MNDKRLQIRNSTAEFLIFTNQAGESTIEVRVEGETVWLTQKLMAVLFEVSVPTINEHLGNLYAQGEIGKDSTIRNFRTVQLEGTREVSRKLDFYNLDAIIAVGFRVNSARAIQFRQWAAGILRDFSIRGYVLDKDRLAADGKQRLTDVADAEQLLRLVQSIPSPKAEPIKLWLAKVGHERMQELADPAQALVRAREIWRQHGRSEKWGEGLWDSKSISAWIQVIKGMLRRPTIPFIPFIQAKKSFVALFALDIRGPYITLTYPLGHHQFAEYP